MVKLTKNKKIIIIVSLIIILCIIAAVIFLFLLQRNSTVTTFSDGVNQAITDVSNENTLNTVLDITDSEKQENIEIPEITTEKVSEKELEKAKVNKKDTTQATSPYYIKVNYGANTVTVYKKDKDGKYTEPVKAMVCSCGTYTPTSGTYKTSSKYRWGKLIHNVYGQYCTRIVGSILFHSVP